ncbi:hypothetical protein DPX16_8237 [Anabarilius grahami]|uniref:Uncharacterized protein n=1 Tax=Anabarilius grahami TaxID=495550 RepID=A0A3N0Y9J7_ANAGA|nr:hypothetical protein DPX16_8237 [Anabarilius grahami]
MQQKVDVVERKDSKIKTRQGFGASRRSLSKAAIATPECRRRLGRWSKEAGVLELSGRQTIATFPVRKVSTSKRYKTQVALADEGEDEGSYCDEEDEIIVTIRQGESEGEREDGDEDEDGYNNLI